MQKQLNCNNYSVEVAGILQKIAFAIMRDTSNGSSSMASSQLAITGPLMAEGFEMIGILESTDEITFGDSNFGFRYFLNMSSPSELINSSASAFAPPGSIAELQDMVDKGYDIHVKEMLILTQKQDDLYFIILLSPKENFYDAVKEIQPSIDSIQYN